ncbi:hypothetical protein ARMSODRAFT_1019980 [Armillaria solidipes]|uniref:Uncharacterized protein n=1 Tax=Armillaria solidipes TaxID=1076256 RepID=A0A2H3BAQ5_9AGAR|nr:hypothetical protein ARMSODRAFT_1019980 [Armillaria solidipes]
MHCVEWEATPRGWEPIGPPRTPSPPGWGNGDQWWGDLAEGEWGSEGQWGSGPWGQDSEAGVQDSDRGAAWGQDPDAGVSYVADPEDGEVPGEPDHDKMVTQLHACVNFETVQPVPTLMHADLWDYFIHPDLHSCIPNCDIEFVMLKLVKPQGPAYTPDQHAHLRKNAVYYYKAKQAGPIALAGFLAKFYAEWFLLFQLDNSLSDLD